MAQTNNIIIGAPGSAGEASTIRIGSTQTSTYCSGIYNKTVGATNAGVYIDSDGQLGTISGTIPPSTFNTFPFLAYQVGRTSAVTGNGSIYYLGSSIAMTEKFDVGNHFSVGTGAGIGKANGCFYTAPADGVYQFQMNIYVQTQTDSPFEYLSFASQFETATVKYEYKENMPPGSIFSFPRTCNNFWFTFQATINLSSTDKVWFNTSNVATPSALVASVGYIGTLPVDPGITTRISGFRVA